MPLEKDGKGTNGALFLCLLTLHRVQGRHGSALDPHSSSKLKFKTPEPLLWEGQVSTGAGATIS